MSELFVRRTYGRNPQEAHHWVSSILQHRKSTNAALGDCSLLTVHLSVSFENTTVSISTWTSTIVRL